MCLDGFRCVYQIVAHEHYSTFFFLSINTKMKSISGKNTGKKIHMETFVSGRGALAKGTIKGYGFQEDLSQ